MTHAYHLLRTIGTKREQVTIIVNSEEWACYFPKIVMLGGTNHGAQHDDTARDTLLCPAHLHLLSGKEHLTMENIDLEVEAETSCDCTEDFFDELNEFEEEEEDE